MKKSQILAAVAAAITVSAAGTAFAAPTNTTTTPTTPATPAASATEPCKVVGKDGMGLIKAGMGECKGAKHACAGQNAAGDADAWITVPKGQCAKINAGDMTGVSADIAAKIVTK